jgi:FMN-dependent NADH-azoreductase
VELQHHIFDYGVANAANLMHTTQEKIARYVGVKYGEDISNEVTNKTTVVVAAPMYSAAILIRSTNQDDTDGTSSIVLPCPSS